MKVFCGNFLRVFGTLLLLFAVLLDIIVCCPPVNIYFIMAIAVSGLLFILLGIVLLHLKTKDR